MTDPCAPRSVKRLQILATSMLTVCGLAASAIAEVDISVLARSGDPAPSAPAGVQLGRFGGIASVEPPVINRAGQVAFMCSVKGPGVDVYSDRAIYLVDPAAPAGSRLGYVARSGDQAAGAPSGIVFSTLGAPMLANSGVVAFRASLSGSGISTSVNGRGYWWRDHGGLRLAVRDGDAVPNTPGVNFSSTSDGALVKDAATPRLSFKANTVLQSGGYDSSGYWQRGQLGTEAIIKAGDPAPTTDARFGIIQRTQTETDWQLIRTTLAGPTVNSSNSQMLWTSQASESHMQPVARQGQSHPSLEPGTTLGELYSAANIPAINGSGQCAFVTPLLRGTATAGSAIWTNRDGALAAIAKTGDPAPIPNTEAVFESFTNAYTDPHVHIAPSGRIVFPASLNGRGITISTSRSLWAYEAPDPASTTQPRLRLLAQGGTPMADLPQGVTIANATLGSLVRVNRRGDVLFLAQLQGPGVSIATDWALFTDVSGQVRMIAREGQEIPGSNGMVLLDFRRQSKIFFNAQGQVVLLADVAENTAGTGTRFGVIGINSRGQMEPIAIEYRELHANPYGSLTISSIRLGDREVFNDSGQIVFSCSVSGTTSGDELLARAQIVEPPACPADLDGSGLVEVADLFAFLRTWFAGNGDWNRDGAVEIGDLFEYLRDFFDPCS